MVTVSGDIVTIVFEKPLFCFGKLDEEERWGTLTTDTK